MSKPWGQNIFHYQYNLGMNIRPGNNYILKEMYNYLVSFFLGWYCCFNPKNEIISNRDDPSMPVAIIVFEFTNKI